MKNRDRIERLEAEVAALRDEVVQLRSRSGQRVLPVPPDQVTPPNRTVDPCAACGPVCGNAFCPKRLLWSSHGGSTTDGATRS